MKKILTISIAAYNAEKYLDNCLKSLIECKELDKMEIFIIDDGSNDETATIAKNYENEYPNSIKVISKINGGHGSTINISIKYATAKYFKIVDADDWIDTANTDLLIKYLEQKEVSLVINPYYEVDAFDNSKKIVLPYDNNVKIEEMYDFDEVATCISWAMHAITLNTNIIKKMGPIIDEKCFYVDAEYIIFPIVDIKNVVVLDYPVYNYLLGTSTQSMNIVNMRKRRDQHLRVSKRLVLYYEEIKNRLNKEKQLLILNKIAAVINLQYVLFMGINVNESYNEIVVFDHWLKYTSPQIYAYSLEKGKKNGSGFIKLLGILRNTNFVFYKPIVGLCQKLKMIE